MKKYLLAFLALVVSFCLGFAFKSALSKPTEKSIMNKRVTGIGGVFFKCKDTKKVKSWYATHLGFPTDQYGTLFKWYEGFDSTKAASTQWSAFSEKTKYFEPSTKDFMLNYRVQNLETLVTELKKEGVTILDTLETFSYGKFIHIMDIEGNKIELWEQTGSF